VSDPITLELGPEVIAALLPHREPIVLVDRLLRYHPCARPTLEAGLSICGDEPVLRGHFPNRPIWPGAYLMEGIAQCAGLLLNLRAIHALLGSEALSGALSSDSPTAPLIGLLARARIDMLEPVVPPAQLHYRVVFMGEFGPLARIDGEVEVAGRRVASGSVSVTLGLPRHD
jgi:3-hydroxyacyl-[acyl-carrier-protein] dehydratase